MSLVYTCPTCKTPREASISASRVFYMIDNRVIDLNNEKEDCANCKDKIAAAQDAERKRIQDETPKHTTI